MKLSFVLKICTRPLFERGVKSSSASLALIYDFLFENSKKVEGTLLKEIRTFPKISFNLTLPDFMYHEIKKNGSYIALFAKHMVDFEDDALFDEPFNIFQKYISVNRIIK